MPPARGERHGSHKLTEAQAREIFKLAWQGNWSFQELATRYGVHKATIQCVKNGRNWAWLNEQEERR